MGEAHGLIGGGRWDCAQELLVQCCALARSRAWQLVLRACGWLHLRGRSPIAAGEFSAGKVRSLAGFSPGCAYFARAKPSAVSTGERSGC